MRRFGQLRKTVGLAGISSKERVSAPAAHPFASAGTRIKSDRTADSGFGKSQFVRFVSSSSAASRCILSATASWDYPVILFSCSAKWLIYCLCRLS